MYIAQEFLPKMLFSYQNQVFFREVSLCFPLEIYFLRTIVQNHEKTHAKCREQYAGNSEKKPEKLRQYSHDYYHWVMKSPEYREKRNAYQRARYRRLIENPENREKVRAYQKAYRQRKKAEKSAKIR